MDLEDLLREPVFDINSEQFLGYVIGTVVDEDATCLLGIVTRTRIARPKMVAPAGSVHLMHDEGIVVEKKGFRWLPMQRAIWRAWRRRPKPGTARVEHNGEAIGFVFDYTVNDDGLVTHIVVHRGFVAKPLHVRRDKVERVEDRTFYLTKDALAKPKAKAQVKAGPGFVDEAAAMFGKTLAKATHTVRSGTRSSLAGKPAPWTISDDEGNVVVAEGKPLTKTALAQEAARGRTTQLAAAVAGGALGRARARRKKKKG